MGQLPVACGRPRSLLPPAEPHRPGEVEWFARRVDNSRMGPQTDTTVSRTAFIATLSRLCRLTASFRRETERRATCRFHVEEDAIPTTVRDGTFVAHGSLVNVSSSGAQIATHQPVGPSTEVELLFSVGAETYRHVARVVRSQPIHGRHLLTVRFKPDPFERTVESQNHEFNVPRHD